MQSTTSMFGLSPAENLLGRISQRSLKLRIGQEAFIRYVSDHPEQPIYNGVLPTGYGKSIAALGSCDVLKQQGRATRFLFIVPTDTQRSQYAINIGETVSKYNLNLRLHNDILPDGKNTIGPMPVIVDGSTKVHRANKENRCEIFIATVQSIVADEGFFSDLMSSGMWCVFCDEYQKLNADESAKWGKAVEKLNKTVMFGLTATPIRTDSKMTVFGSKAPDVVVSLDNAFKEEAIRSVIAHIEHYFVDVENDDGSVDRMTTETINDYDLSKELRYVGKYISSILCSSYARLLEKNRVHENQHQMLVFAMTVRHAKMVSETMNAMFGAGFSDYVGVGPDGRKDGENTTIIRKYRDNELRCLVQVDIAGEGFDNPRSSVLVFLHLLRKATVKAVQQAGRGLRRNYGIKNFKDDICDIFASPDTEMADLAKELAELTMDVSAIGDPEKKGKGGERESPLYSIPPFDPSISDVEYQRSEIISKISNVMVMDFREKTVESGGLSEKESEGVSDERLKVLIAQHLMNAVDNNNPPEKTYKERVTDAQSILVSNVLRFRYGGSIQKGLAGDLHKVINKAWVRVSNGLKHEAMFEEDFRRKHEWLSSINQSIINTREIPLWLQL